MRGAVAFYCLAVGLLMAGWWTQDVRRGAWSRGDRTHAELALHLVAEFVTASWLVASGAALLVAGPRAAAAAGVGLGMLLYTTIVSPGYFVARRELSVTGVFAGLVVLTTIALGVLLSGI